MPRRSAKQLVSKQATKRVAKPEEVGEFEVLASVFDRLYDLNKAIESVKKEYYTMLGKVDDFISDMFDVEAMDFKVADGHYEVVLRSNKFSPETIASAWFFFTALGFEFKGASIDDLKDYFNPLELVFYKKVGDKNAKKARSKRRSR